MEWPFNFSQLIPLSARWKPKFKSMQAYANFQTELFKH